jgi:hypothetical protein
VPAEPFPLGGPSGVGVERAGAVHSRRGVVGNGTVPQKPPDVSQNVLIVKK